MACTGFDDRQSTSGPSWLSGSEPESAFTFCLALGPLDNHVSRTRDGAQARCLPFTRRSCECIAAGRSRMVVHCHMVLGHVWCGAARLHRSPHQCPEVAQAPVAHHGQWSSSLSGCPLHSASVCRLQQPLLSCIPDALSLTAPGMHRSPVCQAGGPLVMTLRQRGNAGTLGRLLAVTV